MIEVIRNTRLAASQALVDALKGFERDDPSECEIRDEWHRQLERLPGLSSEGWYQPPPKGMIVAIGHPPGYERTTQSTFRAESSWPSAHQRLGSDSVLLAYSSRVHRRSGLIGDFGCCLYQGSNPAVRSHLRAAWETTMEIAEAATVGMTFSELYHKATDLITERRFHNDIYSVSDADTNIGHSIPWSDEPLSEEEHRVIHSGTVARIAELVSGKRAFISGNENLRINDAMALTIEPRLSKPEMPTAWFHIVVAFAGEQKTIIKEFDPLFDFFAMHYLKD